MTKTYRPMRPDRHTYFNISAVAPSWKGMPAVLSTDSRVMARIAAGLLRKAGFKDVRLTEYREAKYLQWRELNVKPAYRRKSSATWCGGVLR